MVYIYGIWFILLYVVPFIFLYKVTTLTKKLLTLDGLVLEPIFDEKNSTVTMDGNFDIFKSYRLPFAKNNFNIKIIARMCDNARKGKRVSANAYIANYKEMLDKFIFVIFFSVHIPLIIVLALNIYYILKLLIIHIIALLFVFILKRFADKKLSIFTNVLYTTWYDKIANLDLIFLDRFKPVMLNGLKDDDSTRNLLLTAVNEISITNTKCLELLSCTTADMVSKLDEFINLQNKRESATLETVTASFEENLKKTNEINEIFACICKSINNTLPKFTQLSDKTKLDINAMNKNASLLLELKEQLSAYKSRELNDELNHLQKITDSFENTAINTFKSIETVITQNANDLRSSYDNFFAVCSNFTEAVNKNFEQGTKASLDSLNNNFTRGLKNIELTNTELAQAVKLTSDSTQKLCETVYNFTQFVTSPHFMNKIKAYRNFTQKLNDANSKLISYEKLVKAYEKNDGDEDW